MGNKLPERRRPSASQAGSHPRVGAGPQPVSHSMVGAGVQPVRSAGRRRPATRTSGIRAGHAAKRSIVPGSGIVSTSRNTSTSAVVEATQCERRGRADLQGRSPSTA